MRDIFPTEQACRNYLVRLRRPEGVGGPDCGATEIWSMTPPFYRCARCGYDYEVIQPAAELGDNLLPRVNLVASLLKRWLLETHQGAVRPQHLDYYLDEFTFRFNRRNSHSHGLLFCRLLQQAVAVRPVKGKDLVGGRPLPRPQPTTHGG